MTPRKGKSSNTVKLDRSKETIQKPYLTDQFFFQNCGLMRSNDSYYEHFWLFAGHPTKTAFRNGLKNVQNQTLPCSFMHFTCGLRDPLKHLPWERWWKHGSLPRFSPNKNPSNQTTKKFSVELCLPFVRRHFAQVSPWHFAFDLSDVVDPRKVLGAAPPPGKTSLGPKNNPWTKWRFSTSPNMGYNPRMKVVWVPMVYIYYTPGSSKCENLLPFHPKGPVAYQVVGRSLTLDVSTPKAAANVSMAPATLTNISSCCCISRHIKVSKATAQKLRMHLLPRSYRLSTLHNRSIDSR